MLELITFHDNERQITSRLSLVIHMMIVYRCLYLLLLINVGLLVEYRKMNTTKSTWEYKSVVLHYFY